jgi:hypothetical protein
VVEKIRTLDGMVFAWNTYPGVFGTPFVSLAGDAGGLSADGRTLVLGDASAPGPAALRRESRFLVVDARNLRVLRELDLRGDFGYDALSPRGRLLYLIQHVSAGNVTRYVVRAYDLRSGRLLRRRIADRTQKGWVMQGYPMSRAASADGRFVYTLYQNPGGYPFVHALDSVRGVAHCVGIPYKGSQNAIWNLRLSARDGGRTLSLHWRSGKPYLAIANGTWRITHPAAPRVAGPGSSGFPWWIFGVVGGTLVLVAAVLVTRRRIGFGWTGPARAPQA